MELKAKRWDTTLSYEDKIQTCEILHLLKSGQRFILFEVDIVCGLKES